MHGDLGVVGAGLDAEVAATAGGVEVVAQETREVMQRSGFAVLQAEPVVEQRRAVADRDRQVRGVEVVGLTGVLGRAVGASADDSAGRRLGAGRHPLGCAGPRLQHLAQLVAVLGDDVQGDEVHAVLRRGDDPGLARSTEGRPRRRRSRRPAPLTANRAARHTHRRPRPRRRRLPRRPRHRTAGDASPRSRGHPSASLSLRPGPRGLVSRSVTCPQPLRRPWRCPR